jgi:hypothetical protein
MRAESGKAKRICLASLTYRPKEQITKWIVPDTGIRKSVSVSIYSPPGHEDSEAAKHMLSNCPGGTTRS